MRKDNIKRQKKKNRNKRSRKKKAISVEKKGGVSFLASTELRA